MSWKCYEFQCPKDETVFEELCESNTRTAQCPTCGNKAKRILSATLGFVDGIGVRAEKLKKRSLEHSKTKDMKEQKQTALRKAFRKTGMPIL